MPNDCTGGACKESAIPPPPTASDLRKRLKQAANELDAAASCVSSAGARAARLMGGYAELGPAGVAQSVEGALDRGKHLGMCMDLIRRAADDAQDALGRAISAQQTLFALHITEQREKKGEDPPA